MNRIFGNFCLGVVTSVGGLLASVTGHITAWIGFYVVLAGAAGATFSALNGYMQWRKYRREEREAAERREHDRNG